ncbi:MAG TPA: dethiobiotin synthase [Burkholderiales bacterium]|nr:dethiobiotin synthase [Burkholderiales bacterium]
MNREPTSLTNSLVTSHESRVTRHAFFVTGTDTGVGKTLVACALLHAYAQRGLRVIGMKPVAAGARREHGVLVNEDVAALKSASNTSAADDLVNPYCFEPPIAPHIAAAQAAIEIEVTRIVDAQRALARLADCVIVEGAGGFRVPLSARANTSDLAHELALPVILVVGIRLGCLNHALLTADAVRAAGLHLAGWVANHIEHDTPYADENVGALRERIDAPLIARLAHSAACEPWLMAREIDVARLQEAGARD